MMVTYDPKEDTLRILFRDAPIQTSEVHPCGLILDFDHQGGILGLELTSASQHITHIEKGFVQETAGSVSESASLATLPAAISR